MKVAELKQVVDANAVEMREEFGKVQEQFGKVQEEFGKVREEMHTEFARVDATISDLRTEVHDGFANVREEMTALRQEVRVTAQETWHQMRIMFENFENKVILAATASVDERIDLRVAKAEVRLERKFDHKYGKH
jgi:hypothetical protein